MANGARNGMVAHEEQAPKRQRTANAALLVGAAALLAPCLADKRHLSRLEHALTLRLSQATAAVPRCLSKLVWGSLRVKICHSELDGIKA